MPSDWEWWIGEPGAESYALGTAKSRDEAIQIGQRETLPGEQFEIIEARSSTAMKYEGADFVPFTHRRNHEVFTNGPQG